MKIEDAVFVYRLSSGDRLSWHGRYHAHGANEFEIHFFLEGSGYFLCNRTKYPVSAGRLFLSGPHEFHSIVPDAPAAPLTYYAILFSFPAGQTSPAESPEASESFKDGFAARNGAAAASLPTREDIQLSEALKTALEERQTVLSINSNFRFQFEDLLQLSRSADSALRESARYLLESFLWRWFVRLAPQATARQDSALPSESGVDRKSRIHVEKALSLMEKSVRENVKIEDLAWKLGLSEEHFIRIFRAQVRMTPHQYFTRLKVEGASGLLISTDKAVGEISDWFGFENQFHFSRIFKKCTGMSPLDYRKTYLQIVDFT
ncbi:MAG TPA: AraC family transcriptional regulator [Treponemataceae bacterium]|nr:AraC family transcriptional regulator [Treponemataceae bacterium]HPS43353.1 AraC family transcriptional regulator [Treponemataceae bacterium]